MNIISKRLIIILVIIKLIDCQKCGVKPQENQTGIRVANYGDFPWNVMIRQGPYRTTKCGGSLITDQLVLTAAHCISDRTPNSYSVTLGEWRLNARDTSEFTLGVNNIWIHPEWRGTGSGDLRNDIAILRLNARVILNNIISPVCLPENSTNPIGRKCFISGWGVTLSSGGRPNSYTLMKTSVQILNNNQCNERVGNINRISNGHVCSTDANRGGCYADSGGPLSCQRSDGSWELIGLFSWGVNPCGTYPNVNTRITEYLNYIKNVLSQA